MTSDKKTTLDRRAEAVLVLVTFFWGCTFPIVKEAITNIPIFAFLALRFGLAAILMAPFIKRSQMTPKTIKKGLVLGVLLFLAFAFQTLGLANTSGVRLRLYHRHECRLGGFANGNEPSRSAFRHFGGSRPWAIDRPDKLSIQSGMGRNSDLYLLLVYRLAHYHPRPLGRQSRQH